MSRRFSRISLPAVFVTVATVFAVVVGALGWTLIGQDRDLAEQRGRARLDALALRLAESFTALDRGLSDALSAWDPAGGSSPPEASVDSTRLVPVELLVRVGREDVTVVPDSAVMYLPVPGGIPDDPAVFATIDRLEFRQRDPEAALRALGPLTASDDPTIRLRAELRSARILGRLGRTDEALAAFGRMSAAEPVPIDGIPSTWLGLYGACSLLERSERYDDLEAEAARLDRAVRSGAMPVDRGTWLFYVNAIQAWRRMAGDADLETVRPDSLLHAPSEAVDALVRLYDEWTRGMIPDEGLRSVAAADTARLVRWSAGAGSLEAAVVHPGATARILDNWAGMPGDLVYWSILGSDGRTALTNVPTGHRLQASGLVSLQTVRIGVATWVVRVRANDAWIDTPAERNRRILLILSLIGAVALIGLAGLAVARALRRELRFARMQTEFVAAVSHEFRTPLTSIRQVAELLSTGRVRSAERAETYYGVLEREARRLDRLVERLLDFGRVRSGHQVYEFEPIDPGTLAHEAVEAAAVDGDQRSRVELDIEATGIVRGDMHMLVIALANLVDNALKYSPPGASVRVSVRPGDAIALVSVRDHGIGIDREDLDRVFEPFVRIRGEGSGTVPGTGVGLALVKRIVDDHGGGVSIDSEPGVGTTFTLHLPYHPEDAAP